jgi:hypothetical protein
MVMKNNNPLIKIMKDVSGDLRCYPFNNLKSESVEYAVEYFDYEDGA